MTKNKEVKTMKTGIRNPANALEKLLGTITGYLTENAKCTIGITCYDSPYKAPANTQDLYDDFILVCVILVYVFW